LCPRDNILRDMNGTTLAGPSAAIRQVSASSGLAPFLLEPSQPPELRMLALVLITVLSTASAQDQEADVATPQPEGCWATAASPFPAQDATGVPLDVSPRFYLDGQCVDAVQVALVDAEGTAVSTLLDAQQHDWSTTVIVDPTSDLTALTAYTMTITTELGTPSELRFTTGEAVSAPVASLELRNVMADGWCEDLEQATYSLSIEIGSDDDGLAGYVSSSPTSSFSWVPLLIQNGRANIWVTTDAQFGDTEACASIARIEVDGTLGEWEDVCADTPDLGTCRQRRQLFGCASPRRDGEPVPLASFMFLPLLGLLGLHRRHQS
jgi:hypothetical protein